MIALLALAGALAAADTPEPSGWQGLSDARLVNVREGAADLWLALDSQPRTMEFSTLDGAISLRLDGGACDARQIVPPAGRPVSRITLSGAGADSCDIRLDGQWETASAHLAEGGIIVALEGVAVSAASPVLAPAARVTERSSTGSEAPATQTEAASATAAGGETATSPQTDTATGDMSAPQTGTASRGAPVSLTPSAGGVCAQTADSLEDTPWDLGVMAAHGNCLMEAGRTGDAQTLYERVLAFEPGHFAAALGLARIRASAGRLDEARELFQTAAGAARTDGEAMAARSAAEALGTPLE